MRKCTCDTDPLFYWTWTIESEHMVHRRCTSCVSYYHAGWSVEDVYEYYTSSSTKAFKTLEELELYRIKQRL